MACAPSKDAGMPGHPRSLISTFVVHCLDSITPIVSISKIWSLYLASVDAQVGLSLHWSQTPKTGILVTRLIYACGSSCTSPCSFCLWYEPSHDKTNKMTVRPAKTQISLGIRPVWSESSLCAQWVAKDPSFLHADCEDWSDWVDAQADLSLHWAHMPFCWFCHEAAHILF